MFLGELVNQYVVCKIPINVSLNDLKGYSNLGVLCVIKFCLGMFCFDGCNCNLNRFLSHVFIIYE